MKILLILVAIVSSLGAHANNKHKNWINLRGESEDDIVRQAEILAPKILNAELIDVISFGRRHECEFRVRRENPKTRLRIDSLNISKYYSYDNGEFSPYFKAELFYQFRKCRKKRTSRY